MGTSNSKGYENNFGTIGLVITSSEVKTGD
jgi:hypothetical protein